MSLSRGSVTTLTDAVEQSVRQTFESIVLDELKELEARSLKQVEAMFETHRIKAKQIAMSMTLELMHKMEGAGISVEFKI